MPFSRILQEASRQILSVDLKQFRSELAAKAIVWTIRPIMAIAIVLTSARAAGGNLTISGTVAYQPRMGLPQGTILHLKLKKNHVDTNETSEVVRESKIVVNHNQVPIPFSLEVDRSLIDSEQAYELEALIEIKERAWYSGAVALGKNLKTDVTDLSMLIGPVK